jgi:hypothetical protein
MQFCLKPFSVWFLFIAMQIYDYVVSDVLRYVTKWHVRPCNLRGGYYCSV